MQRAQDLIQKRHSYSEPAEVVPEVGREPEAARGTGEPRIAAPRPATEPATSTVARKPCRTVRRRARKGIAVAILYPFPNIAVRVVETESISLLARDQLRSVCRPKCGAMDTAASEALVDGLRGTSSEFYRWSKYQGSCPDSLALN